MHFDKECENQMGNKEYILASIHLQMAKPCLQNIEVHYCIKVGFYLFFSSYSQKIYLKIHYKNDSGFFFSNYITFFFTFLFARKHIYIMYQNIWNFYMKDILCIT